MGREHEGSFRAHANYLRAFDTLYGFALLPFVRPSVALARLAGRVQASPSLTRQSVRPPDMPRVRRSLANAWRTEPLLALSREDSTEDDNWRASGGMKGA